MERTIEFVPLLSMVQEHISRNYSAALTDEDKKNQLKSYIDKFINDNGYTVPGIKQKNLTDRLYSEMVEYSIITPYLGRNDIEEININAWDDIQIIYSNGKSEKLKEHFYSPQHAVDIIKRLLHESNTIIDNANPMAQGHLAGNTRITAIKTPLVDEDVAVAGSIRLLHPSLITSEQLVKNGTATQKMMDFLCTLIEYGVSVVFAGETSSGKTTLMNAILSSIPDDTRIFSIETGAREISLKRRNKNGETLNNVIHTITRPSDNERYDIGQDKLVFAALRSHPAIIVIGEMRDKEASDAVEASNTGHTVVSTVHSFPGARCHLRIAGLVKKKTEQSTEDALLDVAQSFPIIVYSRRLRDSSRKVMNIAECIVDENGNRTYHTLFRYKVKKNIVTSHGIEVVGEFEQPEIMSDSLKERLVDGGIPEDVLTKFISKGADYE